MNIAKEGQKVFESHIKEQLKKTYTSSVFMKPIDDIVEDWSDDIPIIPDDEVINMMEGAVADKLIKHYGRFHTVPTLSSTTLELRILGVNKPRDLIFESPKATELEPSQYVMSCNNKAELSMMQYLACRTNYFEKPQPVRRISNMEVEGMLEKIHRSCVTKNCLTVCIDALSKEDAISIYRTILGGIHDYSISQDGGFFSETLSIITETYVTYHLFRDLKSNKVYLMIFANSNRRKLKLSKYKDDIITPEIYEYFIGKMKSILMMDDWF